MTLAEQIDLDRRRVFLNTSEFAVSMVNSAGTTISGIASYGQDLVGYEMEGQAAAALVDVSVEDYSLPKRYETLTFGGYEWRVDNIMSGDGHMWKLVMVRDLRAS